MGKSWKILQLNGECPFARVVCPSIFWEEHILDTILMDPKQLLIYGSGSWSVRKRMIMIITYVWMSETEQQWNDHSFRTTNKHTVPPNTTWHSESINLAWSHSSRACGNGMLTRLHAKPTVPGMLIPDDSREFWPIPSRPLPKKNGMETNTPKTWPNPTLPASA